MQGSILEAEKGELRSVGLMLLLERQVGGNTNKNTEAKEQTTVRCHQSALATAQQGVETFFLLFLTGWK